MCKDCQNWFGDIRPEYSYTGCELGIANLELSYYYLEETLIKKETGLWKKCHLFKPI